MGTGFAGIRMDTDYGRYMFLAGQLLKSHDCSIANSGKWNPEFYFPLFEVPVIDI